MKCLKTPPRKVEFIGVSDHYCRSLKNLNQKHPWLTRLKNMDMTLNLKICERSNRNNHCRFYFVCAGQRIFYIKVSELHHPSLVLVN